MLLAEERTIFLVAFQGDEPVALYESLDGERSDAVMWDFRSAG